MFTRNETASVRKILQQDKMLVTKFGEKIYHYNRVASVAFDGVTESQVNTQFLTRDATNHALREIDMESNKTIQLGTPLLENNDLIKIM